MFVIVRSMSLFEAPSRVCTAVLNFSRLCIDFADSTLALGIWGGALPRQPGCRFARVPWPQPEPTAASACAGDAGAQQDRVGGQFFSIPFFGRCRSVCLIKCISDVMHPIWNTSRPSKSWRKKGLVSHVPFVPEVLSQAVGLGFETHWFCPPARLLLSPRSSWTLSFILGWTIREESAPLHRLAKTRTWNHPPAKSQEWTDGCRAHFFSPVCRILGCWQSNSFVRFSFPRGLAWTSREQWLAKHHVCVVLTVALLSNSPQASRCELWRRFRKEKNLAFKETVHVQKRLCVFN